MRLVGLLLVLAGVAHADKRIQDLVPGYEREVAGCEVQVNGATKVANGAAALAKTAEPAERDAAEADAKALADGLALLKEYCAEAASLVAYLKANAAAPYKTVERELDARDNKLRKLRKDARAKVDELGPITRKVIPRMTRTPPAKPEERRVARFPSGRAIELPALGGAWQLSGTATIDTVEYTDKALAARVTAQPLHASCDEQRKALAERPEPIVELDLGAAKDAGAVWYIRYRRPDKMPGLISVMCAPGVTATSIVLPPTQTVLADELTAVMIRMLKR